MSQAFSRLSHWASRAAGRPVTFGLALLIIVLWAASGPLFHYGEIWQLVINTGTTIITFLLLFLVQGSQNRNDDALHAKLDELIAVTAEARNQMISIEDKTDEEIAKARAATLAMR